MSEEKEVLNDELITDIKEEAKKEPKKTKTKSKTNTYLSIFDFVSIIMMSFIIIAIVFTFAFRLVGVVGSSMTNTLQENDWLITVQKEHYERGDIVVITQPNFFNEPLIKRVIATEGETVTIDYDTATVYVDGVPLDEPYTKDDFMLRINDEVSYPYTVPDGHIFCMGDNRNGSTDSRSNLIGPLDERYVLGKAVVRLLPFGDFNIYDYE
ncbi:MAG: signal peptidase I [Acutalibacteraceae bacterium]